MESGHEIGPWERDLGAGHGPEAGIPRLKSQVLHDEASSPFCARIQRLSEVTGIA